MATIASSNGSSNNMPGLTLPSSSSSSRTNGNKSSSMDGLLKATILSVYDLPFADQPTAVTISCCGTTVSSGPPVARHKDRNSFRFSSAPTSTSNLSASSDNNYGNNNDNDGSNVLRVTAPLRALYKSKMTIRVLFANPEHPFLYAEHALKELKIEESSWLILTLKPGAASSAAASMALMDQTELQPSIRIKLFLTGPYRPEVSALMGLFQAWFGLIDHFEETALQPVVTSISSVPLPDKKYFLIPAVPVVTAIVVASPILAGVSVIGLPFILPVVAVLVTIVAGTLAVGGVVFSSTKQGRQAIGGACGPFVDSLMSTPPFQTLMYDTGPRPTPVSVARQVVPKGVWGKLLSSLLIDLVGSSSYLLPVVGEGFDVAWAPMQTILIMAMYEATSPNLKYVSFAEEILPFTDFVPSATVGWALEFGPEMVGMSLAQSPELTNVLTTAASQITGKTPRMATPSTSNSNPQQGTSSN